MIYFEEKENEKMKKVILNDYRNYDERKCRNGGAYGFETEYTRKENGMYKVSYYTTADLDFCPCCGNFVGNDDHSDCQYEEVSEDDVREFIKEFLQKNADDKENCYVSIDGFLIANIYEPKKIDFGNEEITDFYDEN